MSRRVESGENLSHSNTMVDMRKHGHRWGGVGANVMVDGWTVNLGLWNTAGQEDYNRLRPLSYRGADVFILAFSLISRPSYENISKKVLLKLNFQPCMIRSCLYTYLILLYALFLFPFSLCPPVMLEKWVPELRHYAPSVPIVLVGTKLADLRKDRQFHLDYPGAYTISTEQGQKLKKQIGALAYVECSSKTQQNVKIVFDAAIKVILQPPKTKKERKKLRLCYVL
ncbi:hypothetical protein WN943_017913 [Citrus x changshan-huyou]